MEPQHNYSTGVSGMQQQVYGRKKSKKGCFIIAILIFLAVGSGVTYLIYTIFNKATDTFET